MQIKWKVAIAGAEWAYGPGQIAELPDEQAQKFIDSGLAEAVAPAKEPEKRKK